MNNPIPAIRFLRNFPGACRRAAYNIAHGIKVAFSSSGSNPDNVRFARGNLSLIGTGIVASGVTALPLVFDFPYPLNQENISLMLPIKAVSGLFLMCSGLGIPGLHIAGKDSNAPHPQ